MNGGVTYVEVNYDRAWVANSLLNQSGFSWLYEWGMYVFLLVTLAILVWIFFDSITKKKDQKALVPRILAIVGFFAVIPAFIYRFTGNADGVTTLVRLNAEPGTPYYDGPINWNVKWLVQGYGIPIAAIALVGVVLSIVAIVIYASTLQRAKPSTEFVQAFNSQMSSLERKVDEASRSANAASQAAAATSSLGSKAQAAGSGVSSATIIDRKPQAATIIDTPKTGDTLTVKAGANRGATYDLPEADVVIGRDPKGYIVVDDGKVSGKHLKLSYNGSEWSALDLGSTNGTYLNGQRMTGQQVLSNGDTIKIGDTILVFGKSI
ncbi:MAG TPA: hypothetical protein DCP91_11370 [Eggerthellaceae bacterium]|nr:hypothetical protein [Eggerthellaceae bacterium]